MKAFFATLAMVASLMAQADSQTINFLFQQYYANGDLQVRQELLKTARDYTADSTARRELMSILSNRNEIRELRQEAARSLSMVATRNDVERALTQAHDMSTDIDLRATILRSLYKAAPSSRKIKNVLINNILQNHDVRIKKASAFALMNSLSSSAERRNIMLALQNRAENVEVRVELLKLLHKSMGTSTVKNQIEAMAMDSNEAIEVRTAAARIMTLFPISRSSRNSLFRLVAQSQHPSIRKAAASGLKFRLNEADIKWLYLDKIPGTERERNPFNY